MVWAVLSVILSASVSLKRAPGLCRPLCHSPAMCFLCRSPGSLRYVQWESKVQQYMSVKQHGSLYSRLWCLSSKRAACDPAGEPAVLDLGFSRAALTLCNPPLAPRPHLRPIQSKVLCRWNGLQLPHTKAPPGVKVFKSRVA